MGFHYFANSRQLLYQRLSVECCRNCHLNKWINLEFLSNNNILNQFCNGFKVDLNPNRIKITRKLHSQNYYILLQFIKQFHPGTQWHCWGVHMSPRQHQPRHHQHWHHQEQRGAAGSDQPLQWHQHQQPGDGGDDPGGQELVVQMSDQKVGNWAINNDNVHRYRSLINVLSFWILNKMNLVQFH